MKAPEILNPSGVSIIGLGPMGQAMANVLLNGGYSVTVWNRTASKADALIEKGAVRAATVSDALQANTLVILSLTEYSIMYSILNDAVDALNGRLLVNLSSDTPEKAREADTWARSHGAGFLAGAVFADPSLVGKSEAFIMYSGNRRHFEFARPLLENLGRADYLGEDPGVSMLCGQALLDILLTSATGILHAVAMFQSGGVPTSRYGPYIYEFIKILPHYFEGMMEETETGEYNGTDNNMRMMAAAMTHVAHTARDAGINTSLTDLIKDIYDGTVNNGYGSAGLTSIIEILRKPSPDRNRLISQKE